MSTDVTVYETVNNVTVLQDVTEVSVSDDVVNVTIDQSTDETVVTISNEQGLQGPPGLTGDTGPEGPASTVAGPAGPSNVLGIGTVSGGTTASATITGTSPSQTLNLVLPKGDTGSAGPGVPVGGTTGQALVKIDGTNYNTQWATPAATGVTSVSAIAPLSTGGSPITSTGTISISNIANADISTSAAIAQSKLATNTAAQWSAGTAYVVGDLAYNLGVTYRRKVAGTTATAPASDTTNWAAQTGPAANAQTANALALRDSSGNLLIGSGASIALSSSTSPSFGGGLSSSGDITVSDGSLTTATTITGSGNVNASQSILATNGNVSAGDDGATAFPTTTGAGNIRSVNQIITNSTASDSIKTSGGVTAASATLTTGFSTAGVVHNNTSGVLSSSLITNADVAANAAIDISKISGAPSSPLYYQLQTSTSAVSPGTAIFSPFGLGTGSTSGVTLTASTTYAVDWQIVMVGTSSATAHILQGVFSPASSATVTAVAGSVLISHNTTGLSAPTIMTSTYAYGFKQTANNFALDISRSASGATIYRTISFKGYVSIGTGGKIIPALQYTSAGETNVQVLAGSYLSLTPMASNLPSNGAWS